MLVQFQLEGPVLNRTIVINNSKQHKMLGYSQAVRQQTLTLSSRWFESSYPNQQYELLFSISNNLHKSGRKLMTAWKDSNLEYNNDV